MARTDKNHEERKTQIIQAAVQVFAEQGYERTTNQLVAAEFKKRTGTNVTAQLIYHYFDSKESLFREAVQQFPLPHLVGCSVQAAMNEPPAVFFREVARTYLEIFDDPLASSTLKICIAEGIKYPEIAGIIADKIYPAFIEPSMRYVANQTSLGKIKPCHPAVLLSQFFGPLVQQFLPITSALLQKAPFPPPSRDEFLESFVDNFLTGILKT